MDPSPRPEPPSNLPAVPPERRPATQPPWATGRRRASGGHASSPGAGSPGEPGPRPEPGAQPEPGSWGEPDPPGGGAGRGAGGGPPDWWRRLRPRSIRTALGLGLVAAALLLLPFLDDPARWWIPTGLGFGTLALLYLFRLDRLLFGWAPHVAGVVLVAALVWSTRGNPWSWALAVSVGVVLAGLLLLPRWRVLAVGVVLLAVSAVGHQFRSSEIAAQQAQIDAQAGNELRTVLGVDRPQLALVSLDSGVQDGNPRRVCRLVQDAALAQLLAATAAPSCEQAVATMHARAGGGRVTEPDRNADPAVAPGQSVTVDGCRTVWGRAAGPALGRVVLVRTEAVAPTYQISAFRAC